VVVPPVAMAVDHNPLSAYLWLESNNVKGLETLSLPNASIFGEFAYEIAGLIILYPEYDCAIY
jgi:hypothetical protein